MCLVAIVTKTTTTNVHEDQHLVPSPEVSLVVTTTKHWARVSLFKHFTEETTVKSLLNIDNNSARGFIQLKIDSNGSNTVALRLKSEKAANLRLVINLGASVRINNQGSAVRSNHHHAVVQIQPGNKRIQKPLPRHTETINLLYPLKALERNCNIFSIHKEKKIHIHVYVHIIWMYLCVSHTFTSISVTIGCITDHCVHYWQDFNCYFTDW